MAHDVEEELGLLAPIDQLMHPYRERFPANRKLPTTGRPRADVLAELQQLRSIEEGRWKAGYASGSVYHGDDEHVKFVTEAYALNSQVNQLHTDIWPSVAKFEAEIVAMTANMLGADRTTAPFGTPEGICGSVTSGGSESILLAMKTARDWAEAKRGIRDGELVVPVSAHAASHKAAQYFRMGLKIVPLDDDLRVDMKAVADAIGPNTIALVGSAVNFPYGTIDPIDQLGELAQQHGLLLHVDACLGGYFLPWAEKLGRDVPPFDFRVPGVTSISVDLHKYGYTAKGASVLLHRNKELRKHQTFVTDNWLGGLHGSSGILGTKSGGPIAAAWAVLTHLGEEGYLRLTRDARAATEALLAGLRAIPGLRVLAEPDATLLSFACDDPALDAFAIGDALAKRGWVVDQQKPPPSLHCTVNASHGPVIAEFLATLRAVVDEQRGRGEKAAQQAYGTVE